MNKDALVVNFFEAAGELLAAGLADLKRADPKAYQAVNEAVTAGALMTLTTSVNRGGIVETKCTVDAGDECVNLFTIEGRSPSIN